MDTDRSSERFSDRKGQYKKTFDDPRRWRENLMTQIRKDNRSETLNKRRQNVEIMQDTSGTTTGILPQPDNSSTELDNSQWTRNLMTREEINQAADIIRNGDEEARNAATESIRRVLSLEMGPPIDDVINAGLIPLLMEMLRSPVNNKLQFEAAWCITNIASGTHAQTKVVIDSGAIPIFCELLRSESREIREQAVWAIGNLSGDNVDARDEILRFNALHEIKRFITSESGFNRDPPRSDFLVNCTWTISNLLRGKPVPRSEIISEAIPILHKLIYSPNPDVQADACWAVSYITDGGSPPNAPPDRMVGGRINDVLFLGFGYRLVELLVSPYANVQIPALRSVGNIVTGSDEQTQTLVLCGVCPNLKLLLQHRNNTVQKEAVWAVSNITAGNRSQIQEVIQTGLIPLLIDRLQNGESEVRKEAAWALSNAVSGGNREQVKSIVDHSVLRPLCDALMEPDEKNAAVILDAISSILKHGLAEQRTHHLKENPYEVLLEQAGGFDKLEHYADQANYPSHNRLYRRAYEIISRYLRYNIEGEEESAEDQLGPEDDERIDWNNF